MSGALELAGTPDLVRDDHQLIDPLTGEVIDLRELCLAQLGEAVLAIRQFEDQLRAAKGAVSREAHRRMDRAAKWTQREDDYELVGSAPGKVEYQVDQLRAVLRALVEEGLVEREAAVAAIKREVSYKPMKRGIDALMKLGGEVRERIEECAVPVPDSGRRLQVKRKEAS